MSERQITPLCLSFRGIYRGRLPSSLEPDNGLLTLFLIIYVHTLGGTRELPPPTITDHSHPTSSARRKFAELGAQRVRCRWSIDAHIRPCLLRNPPRSREPPRRDELLRSGQDSGPHRPRQAVCRLRPLVFVCAGPDPPQPVVH